MVKIQEEIKMCVFLQIFKSHDQVFMTSTMHYTVFILHFIFLAT